MITVAIIITSICVIPAIGMSIDRVSNQNTVNCGVQYHAKSDDLGVGFTTIHLTNAKDYPAEATADGPNDKKFQLFIKLIFLRRPLLCGSLFFIWPWIRRISVAP